MKYAIMWAMGLSISSSAVQAQHNFYGRNNIRPIASSYETGESQSIQLPGGLSFRDSNKAAQSYTITDHQGSTRTMLNGNCMTLLNTDYDPYGRINESIGGKQKEQCYYDGTYSWTDQTRMYSTATRKYESSASRFISRDPVTINYTPYLFTNGNPINFIDQDGQAPTPVKDYDNPDFATLFGHPAFPDVLHLDDDSYNTLKLIEPGNAFVGILNIKTGDIYLNPLIPADWIPDWKGTDFRYAARMNGDEVIPILHEQLNTSHSQLIRNVRKKNNAMNAADFVGFHIRYSPKEPYLHLGPRSLSAQEGKFSQWISGSKHGYEAFVNYRISEQFDFYKAMYSELHEKYRNESYESYDAGVKARDEMNAQYKATEGDYPDLEQEKALQDFNMSTFWRTTVLKPVVGVPNYDHVIRPILDPQLPLPFANKIFDYFNTLKDLPAPMRLIMKD